jgi:6-phosphogluconolactonase
MTSDAHGEAGGGHPEVVVVPDRASLAGEAAGRIADVLREAVEARGRADWATTGGSQAPAIYRALAGEPLRGRVPWAQVHVWWGDDRFVPRDHPLSNVKPFDDILLAVYYTQGGQVALAQSGEAAPVAIPLDQVHPFPTTIAIGETRDSAWCAATLATELEAAGLARHGRWPVFDLVLLGVGPDGHVLSVFPGSDAFDSTAIALGIPAPSHVEPHVERVTLNPAILTAARRVVVVAAGPEKADVLGTVFGGERDPRRWPAQVALGSNATWVLDAEAAARIDH